jgi:hypothetical protein
MPPAITYDAQAVHALINDPKGGVARFLRQLGEEMVHETKNNLSFPAPPHHPGTPFPRNPTTTPWLRTGDLMRSVRLDLTIDIHDRMLVAAISAPSIHQTRGSRRFPTPGRRQYAADLLEEGFELAPPSVLQRRR